MNRIDAKAGIADALYEYRWGNNPVRARLKGRLCRIVRRLARNSAHVQFIDNGEEQIVSGNALKRRNE